MHPSQAKTSFLHLSHLQKLLFFRQKIAPKSYFFRNASWNPILLIFNIKKHNFLAQHGAQLGVQNLAFFYKSASGDQQPSQDLPRLPKTPKTSSRTPPELLPGSSKPLQNASRALFLDPIWQNLCLFLKFWLNNITNQHLNYSLGPIHSMHFTSLCFIFVGHWFPF